MPKQLSLAGFDTIPRPTDRLFFALFPSAETAELITQGSVDLRRVFGLTGKPIATGRLHITLHHIGDFVGLPNGMVAAASEAAAKIAIPPFDVTLDRATSFGRKPSNRPFVLLAREGIAPLTALQQALGAAMTQARLGRPAERHFVPHLTLLYDDRCIEQRAIEPVTWTAREFVLVHSLLGRTRHVVLGRWSLRA